MVKIKDIVEEIEKDIDHPKASVLQTTSILFSVGTLINEIDDDWLKYELQDKFGKVMKEWIKRDYEETK